MAKQTKKKARRSTRSDGRATRTRLIRAARTMFSAGGYEATSLRQIAGAADVDLATLKYHFGDKPALFTVVYREGHVAFMEMLGGFVSATEQITTRSDARDAVSRLADDAVLFLQEYEWFARLFLYRTLEDSADVAAVEDALAHEARAVTEIAVGALIEDGVIAPVDVSSMLALLVTGIPAWMAFSRSNTGWYDDPHPLSEAGKTRLRTFVHEILFRMLNLRDDS